MNGRNSSRLTVAVALLSAMCALAPSAARAGDGAHHLLPIGERWRDSTSERAARIPPLLRPVRDVGFFTIAPDLRLCPSPLCGGFWVSRVNRAATACADGTLAPSCYVSELDLSRFGLSDEQQASVRAAAGHLLMLGSIRATTDSPFGPLGVFLGQEAWLGHPGIVATGTFYRARDTGIVCITYPCENLRVAPLNAYGPAQLIAGVDLDDVSADPEDGYARLDEPQGLIAAGELVPVSGPGGSSLELRSSEYYVLVVPEFEVCQPGSARSCGRGEFCNLGGKAQCGRTGAPGVCAPRPQACIALFEPVCGCDGITYSNACAAHAAGVGIDHIGTCP